MRRGKLGLHARLFASHVLVVAIAGAAFGKEVEDLSGLYDKAAPYITFGGYQRDIPELLAGCYAGCIPSSGWDSYPMSSLEMQACGVPVIVSDWQGCPETVDGSSGIIVPAGDAVALAQAIARLATDTDGRGRMSRAAAERIRTSLTREHQITALVSQVDSVVRPALQLGTDGISPQVRSA